MYNSTDCILSLNPATLTLKTFKFSWYIMLAFIECNFHCSYRPVLGEHYHLMHCENVETATTLSGHAAFAH